MKIETILTMPARWHDPESWALELKNRKLRAKWLTCDDCKEAKEDVKETICPLCEEVKNEKIKATLCDACYKERLWNT